jgi:hypothetical protein
MAEWTITTASIVPQIAHRMTSSVDRAKMRLPANFGHWDFARKCPAHERLVR